MRAKCRFMSSISLSIDSISREFREIIRLLERFETRSDVEADILSYANLGRALVSKMTNSLNHNDVRDPIDGFVIQENLIKDSNDQYWVYGGGQVRCVGNDDKCDGFPAGSFQDAIYHLINLGYIDCVCNSPVSYVQRCSSPLEEVDDLSDELELVLTQACTDLPSTVETAAALAADLRRAVSKLITGGMHG